MGKRLAIGLLLASAPAVWAGATDVPVCDDADHCVWLMENHGPHEFDYEVLTRELEGFGNEGKSFLIMLVGDKDADIAGRAIDILNDGRFSFSRDEARKIVQEWPGSNMDKMANLMVKIGTPDVQGRMIESLLSDNKKVRNIARDVLAKLRANKKIYQLRSFEYGPLAKAVVEEPTRELVQMLAAFPPDKTTPFLKRALTSPDGPSVIAAYDGLYGIDKDMAFGALLEALRNLSPEQAETAFAIGELLRHRNQKREDGFYMKFAKELAEDPEMSLMGRVAGLDAVLGGRTMKASQKTIGLATTPPVRSALRAALSARAYDIHPYQSNFSKVFSEDKPNWAISIWNHILNHQQKDGRIYGAFFRRLEKLEKPVVQRITLQALGQVDNVKILEFALASVRSQNDKIYLGSIERLTEHWADDVRYNAKATITILKSKEGSFDKLFRAEQSQDKKRWKICKVKSEPLTNYVMQLPYFTLEEEVSESIVKRRFIRTAYPSKDGWFVGFSGAKSGGLWYFENESGLGDPVNSGQTAPVNSVMPIRLPKPGLYVSEFWVMSADAAAKGQGLLYTATQNGQEIDVRLHRYLPRDDFAVSILPQGRYLLAHETHSPLILGADGTLKPACE